MATFKFTLGEEIEIFLCEDDIYALRKYFDKNFPNVTLFEEYCMCMDACSCENGHYVGTSRWESKDPTKPWIGENVEYSEPLYVEMNCRDKKKKATKTEFVHYFHWRR